MRLMFEKELFGREIVNIIACEGFERVERAQTYKQWQLRNMRNGFRPLPLDQRIIDKLKGRLPKIHPHTQLHLQHMPSLPSLLFQIAFAA